MIKLLILGPAGTTSKLISKLALIDKEIDVVAACDITHIDEDLSFILGVNDPNKIKINDVNNLQDIINGKIDPRDKENTHKNSVYRNRIRKRITRELENGVWLAQNMPDLLTDEWWESKRHLYDLVTSELVIT